MPSGVFTELRIEVNIGQYLDLLGTAKGTPDAGAGTLVSAPTSPASTRSNDRCTWAPRSPGRLGDLECALVALSGCRSARRSSSATTCSASSATQLLTGKPRR